MPGPADRYEKLEDYISLEGMTYFASSYRREEIEILQPRLEELGYTDIKWLNGERDSFGPLTRVCQATRIDGIVIWFIYG